VHPNLVAAGILIRLRIWGFVGTIELAVASVTDTSGQVAVLLDGKASDAGLGHVDLTLSDTQAHEHDRYCEDQPGNHESRA
jgi:hypothetical protein